MATSTASGVSTMSYFTINRSDPYRHARRLISRQQQRAPNSLTGTPSPTELRSALRQGSSPTNNDFDRRLGAIGSGPPKKVARRTIPNPVKRPKDLSWGDMSNLRPDDRGMDPEMCLEVYRLSTSSGEQEPPSPPPPPPPSSDSSNSSASSTKKVRFDLGAQLATPSTEEKKEEVRAGARERKNDELVPKEFMKPFIEAELVSAEYRRDREVPRPRTRSELTDFLAGVNSTHGRPLGEQGSQDADQDGQT